MIAPTPVIRPRLVLRSVIPLPLSAHLRVRTSLSVWGMRTAFLPVTGTYRNVTKQVPRWYDKYRPEPSMHATYQPSPAIARER